MAAAAQTMEFERAAEYRDLIQAIGTLRTKQRVMAKDLQKSGCLWLLCGQGLDVCSGFLCSSRQAD